MTNEIISDVVYKLVKSHELQMVEPLTKDQHRIICDNYHNAVIVGLELGIKLNKNSSFMKHKRK